MFDLLYITCAFVGSFFVLFISFVESIICMMTCEDCRFSCKAASDVNALVSTAVNTVPLTAAGQKASKNDAKPSKSKVS